MNKDKLIVEFLRKAILLTDMNPVNLVDLAKEIDAESPVLDEHSWLSILWSAHDSLDSYVEATRYAGLELLGENNDGDSDND